MSEKPSPYRWVILLLAGLASFPMLAGMTSFPIAAPQLGVFTPEQIADADGWVLLGYLDRFRSCQFRHQRRRHQEDADGGTLLRGHPSAAHSLLR